MASVRRSDNKIRTSNAPKRKLYRPSDNLTGGNAGVKGPAVKAVKAATVEDVKILPVEDEFKILPVEDYEPEFVGGNAVSDEVLATEFPAPDLDTYEQYDTSAYEATCDYEGECHGEASFKPVVDRMLLLNGVGPLPKSVNDKIVGCGLSHHDHVCNHALPMAVYKYVSNDLQKNGIDFSPRGLMSQIKSDEFRNSLDYRRAHAQLRRALNRASKNLDEGRDILDGIDDMVGGSIISFISDAGNVLATPFKEGAKVLKKAAVGTFQGIKFVSKQAYNAAKSIAKKVAPVVWDQIKTIGEKGIAAAGNILESQGPMALTSLLGVKGAIASSILKSILDSGGNPADPQTQAAAYDAAATYVKKVKSDPDEVNFLVEALNDELGAKFEEAEIDELNKAA